MRNLRLETERLILRTPRMADAPGIAELIGEWDVARMLATVPYPYRTSDAEAWLRGQVREEGWIRNPSFIVTLKENEDAPLGCVGLTAGGAVDDDPAFGYWLGRSHWGKGLTTEAGRRVIDFAFTTYRAARLKSGYFEDNAGSARVQEKLGFRIVDLSPHPCMARGGEVLHVNTIMAAPVA